MQSDSLNIRLREDLARRGLQQPDAGGDVARTSEVRRLRSDGSGMWFSQCEFSGSRFSTLSDAITRMRDAHTL